jgi:hypothetical protein
MNSSFTTLGVVLFLAIVAAAGRAQAQSFSNGDLSKGVASWRGDRDVVDDPDTAAAGNKVLAVELKKKAQTFSQQVDAGNAKSVTFTFDVKGSADYVGDGVKLTITRGDGSYFWQTYLKIGPAWQKQELKVGTNGSRKLEFSVEVKPGRGMLYFDNFAVK